MSIYEASSSSTYSQCAMRVQLVSKSKSERLLEKYFDAFEIEFEFECEQSGLWSPPVWRTAFGCSPRRELMEHEMVERLRSVLEARNGGSSSGCTANGGRACFHVWGCIASLFCAFQKRVKRRREITYAM